MSSLRWKWNRLKLMTLGEVVWRVQQVLQKKVERVGLGLALSPPLPQNTRTVCTFVRVTEDFDERDDVCVNADDILAGCWQIFGLAKSPLGFPPQWNRDPKTGTVAPTSFGKGIDYRREEIVGDIKYLWEPSRHLELVTLALAWRTSGDTKYLIGAGQLLSSWFDQCPYPNGVHWTSSLELAVRLVNWSFAWQLIDGDDSALFHGEEGARLKARWLASIYQHCHFICGYFSRYSSANNHLFGEYMGLFMASVVWPLWPESKHWQRIAHLGLEHEARAQNFDDGVNREQAIYYHHEVMDMMLLCERAGTAAKIKFSDAYMRTLEQMAEFLHAIMDCAGNVPMIGDADDALMVRLAYRPGWSPYKSLLASCAVLFQRHDFLKKAGHIDSKTQLLFDASYIEAIARQVPAKAVDTPRTAFPIGGYYLLGTRFGTPDEVRAVIDCGPLGFLAIAAHGHADALAMTLSVGGHQVLVDPGTFSYHTQKRWRNYFRSTSAHNTVEVDHTDQSEIGGNFMWLRKATATEFEHQVGNTIQSFVGEHDGYKRLSDPVVHRREIRFDTAALVFEIIDTLTCATEHEISISWHFAEDCLINATGSELGISFGSGTATMKCDKLALQLLGGSDSPLGGWISRKFDEKAVTTTARWRGKINGKTAIRTYLHLHPNLH
jgi:hypothetical protein